MMLVSILLIEFPTPRPAPISPISAGFMWKREISSQNMKAFVLCKKNLKKEQLAILAVTAEIRFQNARKIRAKVCMVTSHLRSDRSLLFRGLVTTQQCPYLCLQPTVLVSSIRLLLKFCPRTPCSSPGLGNAFSFLWPVRKATGIPEG